MPDRPGRSEVGKSSQDRSSKEKTPIEFDTRRGLGHTYQSEILEGLTHDAPTSSKDKQNPSDKSIKSVINTIKDDIDKAAFTIHSLYFEALRNNRGKSKEEKFKTSGKMSKLLQLREDILTLKEFIEKGTDKFNVDEIGKIFDRLKNLSGQEDSEYKDPHIKKVIDFTNTDSQVEACIKSAKELRTFLSDEFEKNGYNLRLAKLIINGLSVATDRLIKGIDKKIGDKDPKDFTDAKNKHAENLNLIKKTEDTLDQLSKKIKEDAENIIERGKLTSNGKEVIMGEIKDLSKRFEGFYKQSKNVWITHNEKLKKILDTL